MQILRAKVLISFILFALLAGAALVGAKAAAPQYKVGVTTRSFIPLGPYDWRGAQTQALLTTIWYPTESSVVEEPQWIGPPDSPLLSAGRAAVDAKLLPSLKKFPLIVLSHGTGGSALTLAWLGTTLASHGYVVAAVNHPGNNALETYTVRGFSLWWLRAKDLSVVIDEMLVDAKFGSRIDASRIAAAGFSLGGYTMIEIAGGITDRSAYSDFCKSSEADNICKVPPEFSADLFEKVNDLAKSDPQFQTALGHASDSYRDPRVRAVFAIAPALGPAFRPYGLNKISIPVEIVAGESDENVPILSSAKFIASQIPHAKLVILPGGVAHYTFLTTCTDRGHQLRPLLCNDAPGIDRDAIHAKTAAMAVNFFAANLK